MPRAALALLVLAGCGPSAADLEPLRAGVESKLAAIEAAGELAKKTGPLGFDKLEVPGPSPDFPPFLGKENALAFAMEDLEDLAATSTKYRLVTSNPVAALAAWARKGVTPKGIELGHLVDRARRLPSLKYVLILRTTGGVDSRTLDHEWFTGGKWEGEALLFDLDAKTLLGGFRFQGQNDATVSVDRDAPKEGLIDNLRKNALEAVKAEFKKRFPAGNPPFEGS